MVADFYHLNAIPIITLELMRGACGFRYMAQVLQLVRTISAVIITITDEGFINAEPILTGKLFLIAGGVYAVPLITVVTTVIVPVTPVMRPSITLSEVDKSQLFLLPEYQVNYFNNNIPNVISLPLPESSSPTNLQQWRNIIMSAPHNFPRCWLLPLEMWA